MSIIDSLVLKDLYIFVYFLEEMEIRDKFLPSILGY